MLLTAGQDGVPLVFRQRPCWTTERPCRGVAYRIVGSVPAAADDALKRHGCNRAKPAAAMRI
jgi:hypothetical protein